MALKSGQQLMIHAIGLPDRHADSEWVIVNSAAVSARHGSHALATLGQELTEARNKEELAALVVDTRSHGS